MNTLSRVKQNPGKGLYNCANPAKYKGDPKRIIWRSWLECRWMMKLDNNPSVKWWTSEEMHVPYVSPVDGKPHKYYPDFIFCVEENGKERVTMLEIKPSSECLPPKARKSKTGRVNRARFIKETYTWKVNEAKWRAAEIFCKANGWTFRTMTEVDINGMS